MLVAVEPGVSIPSKGRKWICRCDCGNEKQVYAGEFNLGRHTSCGCKGVEPIEIGAEYNKWMVLEKRSDLGITKYLCRCRCGSESLVSATDLRHDRSRMCRMCGNAKRLDYGVAARNTLIKTYRKNARSRGHECSLSIEEFERLFASNCHYCLVPPYALFNGKYLYNGIDRMNNDIGYVAGNVVPCCGICNRAKRAMPYLDFVAWIDGIVERHS